MAKHPKDTPPPDDDFGIGVLPDGTLDIVEEGAPPFQPTIKPDLQSLSVEELDEIISANES